MINQWILKCDDNNEELYCGNFDDYGYGFGHSPSIGDEIEASGTEDKDLQFGIVLDIIRNIYGDPVCYKVWRGTYDENRKLSPDKGCFDYIRADMVSLCEPCGSSEWSLGRIGYKLQKRRGNTVLYNKKTKDVITVW